MSTDLKTIEELKFIIGRFDHYYDSVNNKANLYLAVTTFMLGGVIAGFAALNEMYHFNWWIQCLLMVVLAFNLLAVCYTLAAIKPFLRKNNGIRSMIYFADVDTASEVTLTAYWNNFDEAKFKEDLITQYKILSAGLNKKFNWLIFATWFIGMQIAGIVLFGIIFFIKY